MSEWQPIETAPKDGTPILGYGRWGVQMYRWYPDEFIRKPQPHWQMVRSLGKRHDLATQPTHWMPLPDPPVAAQMEKQR